MAQSTRECKVTAATNQEGKLCESVKQRGEQCGRRGSRAGGKKGECERFNARVITDTHIPVCIYYGNAVLQLGLWLRMAWMHKTMWAKGLI